MMEFVGGSWTIHCDDCGCRFWLTAPDFGAAVATIQAAGWWIEKYGSGTWLTECPDCNEADTKCPGIAGQR